MIICIYYFVSRAGRRLYYIININNVSEKKVDLS